MKLNLGCGENKIEGYVNVDRFGEPDVKHNLETFSWPWADNSIDEVLLNHVLEHLGETVSTYLQIIKELYRICKPNATITIYAPHPRHDDFITDPTHVRAVTAESFALFSKRQNREWIEMGAANSPLGVYLDVDFEIVERHLYLDEEWSKKLELGRITQGELDQAVKRYNNVIKDVKIVLRVIKRRTK